MNRMIRMGLVLASLVVLSACAQAATPSHPPVPDSFVLGDTTLLSLNSAVTLADDYDFQELHDPDVPSVSYLYSRLENGSSVARAYAKALVRDWDHTVQKDGSVDFSHKSGQVILLCPMDDNSSYLHTTIQWEPSSCAVTLRTAETILLSPAESAAPTTDIIATPTPDSPLPSGPITLDEAVRYLESFTPAELQLNGSSMEEFIVLCQEGTVYLNDSVCLLLNVYRSADHKFQHSYLLTIPERQVYLLDRSSGEAVALS